MSTLDEYLLSDAPEPPEDAEPSQLGVDEIAGLLRRLSVLEKRIATNAAMAEGERQRITQWEVMENEPLQKQAIYLRSILEGHMEWHRGKTGAKSISTPYGKITSTEASGKLAIVDEQAFIAWAKESGHGDLIKTTEAPRLADIKKALKVAEDQVMDEDGSIVEGIEWRDPEKPYNIQVKPAS